MRPQGSRSPGPSWVALNEPSTSSSRASSEGEHTASQTLIADRNSNGQASNKKRRLDGSISVGKRPRASLPVSLDATTLSMTRNSIATTPTRPRPSQQRLSLTQPNLTAITRVNRPKKRKAKESTTESSSELPETVIGSYKKDRGLARNDRNPRSSLGIGRAGPSAKKTKPFPKFSASQTSASISSNAHVPGARKFLVPDNEVYEVSDDDDEKPVDRRRRFPLAAARRKSLSVPQELIVISSDEERPPPASAPINGRFAAKRDATSSSHRLPLFSPEENLPSGSWVRADGVIELDSDGDEMHVSPAPTAKAAPLLDDTALDQMPLETGFAQRSPMPDPETSPVLTASIEQAEQDVSVDHCSYDEHLDIGVHDSYSPSGMSPENPSLEGPVIPQDIPSVLRKDLAKPSPGITTHDDPLQTSDFERSPASTPSRVGIDALNSTDVPDLCAEDMNMNTGVGLTSRNPDILVEQLPQDPSPPLDLSETITTTASTSTVPSVSCPASTGVNGIFKLTDTLWNFAYKRIKPRATDSARMSPPEIEPIARTPTTSESPSLEDSAGPVHLGECTQANPSGTDHGAELVITGQQSESISPVHRLTMEDLHISNAEVDILQPEGNTDDSQHTQMDEPLAEATTSSKNDMPALDGIRHIRRRLTNTIDQSTDLPLPSNLAPTDLRLRSSDVDHLTTALITNTHEPASEFPSAGQSDRISDAENATMSDIDPLNIRSPEPSLSSSSPNPPDNAQSLQLDATMESPEPTTGGGLSPRSSPQDLDPDLDERLSLTYPDGLDQSAGPSSRASSSMSRPGSSRHMSYSSRSTCDPNDLFDYNSEHRSDTGGSDGAIIEAQKFGKDLPYITWKDIRNGYQLAKPKYLLAKDLPHALQDHMNAMDTYWRAMPMNRVIFEASIVENTMHDEPDAPLIKILNDIDDEPTPPWEFHYSNQMWHGEGVPAPDLLDLISCDCRGGCDPKSETCACLKRQRSETLDYTPDFAYDQKGQLTAFDIPIFECNDLCGCGNECRNRVVQQGRTCAVNIGKTKDKGWGVFAGPKKIPSGTFIGIYAGELLTDAVSEMRGLTYNKCGRTYLFDIDFHHLKHDAEQEWEPKYVVDAYHSGNFTRFLNHSCDPNCSLNPCYINDSNIDKPLLAVFTQRDVEPREELCFSYTGPPNDTLSSDGEGGPSSSAEASDSPVFLPCRCGSDNCTGIMFT